MKKKILCWLLSAALSATAVIPTVFAEPEEGDNPVVQETTYDKVAVYGDVDFYTAEGKAESSDPKVVSVSEDNKLSAVGVGEAIITIDGEEEGNEQKLNVKVDPKTIKAGELGVFDKQYDGEKAGLLSKIATDAVDVIAGDDVYVSAEKASADFETSEIGKDINVTISGLELAGADAANYVLESNTATVKADIVETLTAADIAESITSIYQPKGMMTLNVPDLPDGYTLTLKSSSDYNVVGRDLSVMSYAEEKQANIVLTVSEIPAPTPEVEETPTPEVEETPTPEAEETPTPEAEETPTPEAEETPTPEAEETPTPEAEETPTPEVAETPTPEVEETPTPETAEKKSALETANENITNDTKTLDTADTKEITVKVPAVEKVQILASASNGSVSGAAEYEFGDEVTLTATADADYTFTGWKVGGVVVSRENPYVFKAECSMNIEAQFLLNGSEVVNVTVERSSTRGTVSGGGTYAVGDTVTLTADGNLMYWSVNGEKVSESNPYVFTAVEDVTVTAYFYKSGGGSLNNNYVYYNVKFNSNGGSSVSDMKVAYNTLVPQPEDPTRSGYKFLGWYSDEELTQKYTFKERLLENLTLYAAWEKTAQTEEEILPFTDVKTGDWYYSAVEFVYNSNLMLGMTDTRFEPDTTLTRAMFVTVLYRSEGEENNNGRSGFNDVDSNAWYAKAVTWAVDNGIVEGYDSNTFGPNDKITREQMAAIIYRYAKYSGYDMSGAADLTASDANDVSDWALSAMKWALDVGIVSGMDDGRLLPQGTATRAQCASILMRCVQNLKLMHID